MCQSTDPFIKGHTVGEGGLVTTAKTPGTYLPAPRVDRKETPPFTAPPKFPRIGVVETKVIRVEGGADLGCRISRDSEMTRVLVDDPHLAIPRREEGGRW